jgi:hypothetical protein
MALRGCTEKASYRAKLSLTVFRRDMPRGGAHPATRKVGLSLREAETAPYEKILASCDNLFFGLGDDDLVGDLPIGMRRRTVRNRR